MDMFKKLKSKQFEYRLEKALETEMTESKSEAKIYSEIISCYFQILSFININNFYCFKFPDYEDGHKVTVDAKEYDLDNMFCHNNSAGKELLYTIDCLIADLDEGTASALKNIEKKMRTHAWWDDYQGLDLCGGKITFISEDDEDMINITYDDGMLIEVGKPVTDDYYCITVVASNDESGWRNPISEITAVSKEDLVDKLQETIMKFRQM